MRTEQILEYIRLTVNEEPDSLESVNGGLTQAEKYKVRFVGKSWMVKILQGDSKRNIWYEELNKRSNDQMANPKFHRLFEDGTLCLVSPWINGENLESCLAECTPEMAQAYGKQAARILLQLHKETVELVPYAQRFYEKTISICEQVESLGLTFPGHNECVAYLRQKVETRKPSAFSFVHRDVRPENFIISDGKLYLIDFDNGSLGEYAADFPYLTTMVRPEQQVFSKALIEAYCHGTDMSAFWEDNLFYSTLQVVDYAIWKWHAKGRQVQLQADNLLYQYDCFSSFIPKWWN